jgi:hypothetical protein
VGVRIDEVPILPEKIVKALEARDRGKTARFGPTRFPDVAWPEALLVPPPWEGGDGKAKERTKAKGSGLSAEASEDAKAVGRPVRR